ncbi:MAG: DNA translocase FtsK [Alphaproteobacteria bacterium]|nr:MAG: DNA translocase FtsK [Alphaproteobacteria bacterium]
MRAFVVQFLWTLIGMALVSAALIAGLALATFSIADPSLNNATGNVPSNLFGYAGAIFADLSLQIFGAGAYAVILPFLIWGWLTIVYRADSDARFFSISRMGLWGVIISLTCLAFAALPIPMTWPYGTSLGGLTGDSLMAISGDLLASWGAPVPYFVTGIVSLTIIAGILIYLAGLQWLDLVGAKNAALDIGYWCIDAAYWVRGTVEDLVQSRGFRLDRRADDFADENFTDNDDVKKLARKARRQEPRLDEFDGEADNEPPIVSSDRIKRSTPSPRGRRERTEAQPTLDLGNEDYELPPLSLLVKAKEPSGAAAATDEALEQNARMLEDVLQDFGIRGEIIEVRPGPVVTLYELEPAPGIKSSRVIGLADDIARSMSAVSARVAVVPGRNVIGIELPNSHRELVNLRDLLSSKEYERTTMNLPLALGKDIGGEPVINDISSMPHLLVAGTTGSGKSVSINTMILSLLYRLPPSQCRMIMIDPKMLELSVYDGIPHLLAPVVTDPRKAIVALKWVVREMEDRYRNMSKLGVRSIKGFNERIAEAREDGEVLTRTVQTGFDRETGQPIYETQEISLEPMPFIVVVIDEMADLMMVAGKDIENAVQRLAQMARAAGIHMIMATQRPSVDVITGTIKANFPTRISFQVTSKIDSRTILGEQGAEQLLGMGDMLYMAGGGRINRVHGPFVSDNEVEKVVRFLKKQGKPQYLEDITEEPDEGNPADILGLFGGDDKGGDELYDRAVAIVAQDGKASTSYIQRKLQIGYNRAARIIEQMEEEGVVGPANHAGKREIMVGDYSDY